MADAAKKKEDDYTNIFSNAILPYNPQRMSLLMGSAQYVAIEVIVSKIVRKFMKADRSWADLVCVHALSLPLMGGAAGFAEPDKDYTAEWSDQFTAGAKGIPAVIAAEWILRTFYAGFHAPWFNMKDLLITAGAKTISRPIASGIYKNLPDNMADSLALVNELINRQNAASSLKSKKDAAVAAPGSAAVGSTRR